MGQVLHGSATTTEAIRRAIQHSQASLRTLAKRYGINQKTVAKWKKRTSVADLPTGPKQAKSTVLSLEEEAVVVAFRRYTLLPLDDCLYALQPKDDLAGALLVASNIGRDFSDLTNVQAW
jgi:transposase